MSNKKKNNFKKRKVKKEFDYKFGRKINVRGKKIPLNNNTIKLFLYLGVYAVIIFDLIVMLLLVTTYFPNLNNSNILSGAFISTTTPAPISNAILNLIPFIYTPLLVILLLFSTIILTFIYVKGKSLSTKLTNALSILLLLSGVFLASFQLLSGIVPFKSYITLLALTSYILIMFLLILYLPLHNKIALTPNINSRFKFLKKRLN